MKHSLCGERLYQPFWGYTPSCGLSFKYKCTKRGKKSKKVCGTHKNKLVREGWKAVKI